MRLALIMDRTTRKLQTHLSSPSISILNQEKSLFHSLPETEGDDKCINTRIRGHFTSLSYNSKYSQMTDGLTNLTHKVSLVMTMVGEVSNEYLATFNRRLETQFYNELRRDYAFPRAVCRSLSELLVTYLDLYFGGQRKEGQVIFHAVSKEVPPGVPVDEMQLLSIKLTLYAPEDCSCKTQHDLLNRRILRLTGEAFGQGALLTQADIAILLSESTKTVARHIRGLENHGHVVPTRGSWKDIGPGVSHKKRILELYLKGDEYTEIERKTKHSGEAIMRYVKDFARVLVLTEEEYSAAELRIVTGLSDKIIREYQELIEQYLGQEYRERLEHLRAIFKKRR
jgi:hypothetical protein